VEALKIFFEKNKSEDKIKNNLECNLQNINEIKNNKSTLWFSICIATVFFSTTTLTTVQAQTKPLSQANTKTQAKTQTTIKRQSQTTIKAKSKITTKTTTAKATTKTKLQTKTYSRTATVQTKEQNKSSATKKFATSLPDKSTFLATPDLEERVQFWIDIYSKYTTSQGVFHLVHRPEVILGEIDLTQINRNSVLSDAEKQKQANRKIAQQRQYLLKKWKIKNPREVRLQMGLKDRMEKAFYYAGRYLPMMENIFKQQKIPIELTRLVFVESSFNVYAQSKVGASGLWQIMPFVAKPEGYIHSYYDKRNHPYYSTKLAAQILKTNYRSLKSWSLAVTAYNHGLTGVKRMSRKTGTYQLSKMIESNARTNSWGFASENFYACFLAVLEVERNATNLFGETLLQARPLNTKNIYLKTAMTKHKVLQMYGGSYTQFKSLNPHIRLSQWQNKKALPAGVPLVVMAGSDTHF